MRKLWVFLCIFPLLLMSLLPVGCSCNCSTDNDGVGGGWRPEALGLSNDMNGDNPGSGLSFYESFESLSPDGSKLLRYHDRSLYVMNPDGTDEKELVSGDDTSRAMSLNIVWSPDSSKIAYPLRLPEGTYSEIWVIGADGSGLVRVGGVPAKYGISSMEWSADGAQITYTGWYFYPSSGRRYEGGSDRTYTVNADGTDLVEVSNILSGFIVQQSWSPDGDKVAYGLEGDIWVMDVDGTNQTKLTSGWGPEWSSDGTQIAYEYDDGFWVMNADGTNQTRIGDAEDYSQIVWAP